MTPFVPALRGSWRLVRRGTLLLWLAVASYVAMEVLSYEGAYQDQASRDQLVQLGRSPVVRMLQGVPGPIDTTGGFAVWDAGWMLALIVGIWALLTTTRLTRGEEDAGRSELLLSRPVTAGALLGAQLAAVGIGVAGLAVSTALPLVLVGTPVGGAVLFGLGVGLFAGLMAGIGAVCGQLLDLRRHAVTLGLAFTAVAFLVRVVANSAPERAWLLTVTPFGWLDRLEPFGGDRWLRLLVPALAAGALVAAALRARGSRDSGAAVLRTRDRPRARLLLLSGWAGFGWRLSSGALVAWAVTVAAVSAVFGLMVGAVVDLIEEDDEYSRLLESMGVDMSVPVTGFLSFMAIALALVFACFPGWRLGAARQEEAEGRLENLLVRGVVRWRWLSGTALMALAAGLVVVALSTAGLWLGAVLADAQVQAMQVLEPMAGTLPVLALFTGLAVLVFAVAPRLTVVAPVTLAFTTYLLGTFGTMLRWPDAVLSASPFHHLARLPGAPMSGTSIAAMTGVGVLAAAVGVWTFSRRDLAG